MLKKLFQKKIKPSNVASKTSTLNKSQLAKVVGGTDEAPKTRSGSQNLNSQNSST